MFFHRKKRKKKKRSKERKKGGKKLTRPETRLPKSRVGGQELCGWAGAIFEVTRPFGQEQ